MINDLQRSQTRILPPAQVLGDHFGSLRQVSHSTLKSEFADFMMANSVNNVAPMVLSSIAYGSGYGDISHRSLTENVLWMLLNRDYSGATQGAIQIDVRHRGSVAINYAKFLMSLAISLRQDLKDKFSHIYKGQRWRIEMDALIQLRKKPLYITDIPQNIELNAEQICQEKAQHWGAGHAVLADPAGVRTVVCGASANQLSAQQLQNEKKMVPFSKRYALAQRLAQMAVANISPENLRQDQRNSSGKIEFYRKHREDYGRELGQLQLSPQLVSTLAEHSEFFGNQGQTGGQAGDVIQFSRMMRFASVVEVAVMFAHEIGHPMWTKAPASDPDNEFENTLNDIAYELVSKTLPHAVHILDEARQAGDSDVLIFSYEDVVNKKQYKGEFDRYALIYSPQFLPRPVEAAGERIPFVAATPTERATDRDRYQRSKVSAFYQDANGRTDYNTPTGGDRYHAICSWLGYTRYHNWNEEGVKGPYRAAVPYESGIKVETLSQVGEHPVFKIDSVICE